MTRSTGWLAAAGVVAAGCAVPELRTVGTRTLFEGGDGLEVAVERVLSGTLTADTVLDAAEPWILDGNVFVGDDGDRARLSLRARRARHHQQERRAAGVSRRDGDRRRDQV